MFSLFILLIFACFSTAHPALSFQHDAQIPLSIPQRSSKVFGPPVHQYRETEAPHTFVGMLFRSSSPLDVPLQYLELPLGERVSSIDFPLLPIRPAQVQVINATTRVSGGRQPVDPSSLKTILCLAYPQGLDQDSSEAVQAHDVQVSNTSPIWWTFQDGLVDLQDVAGRWSLREREIESYECL